jgi:hypothetical protein
MNAVHKLSDRSKQVIAPVLIYPWYDYSPDFDWDKDSGLQYPRPNPHKRGAIGSRSFIWDRVVWMV